MPATASRAVRTADPDAEDTVKVTGAAGARRRLGTPDAPAGGPPRGVPVEAGSPAGAGRPCRRSARTAPRPRSPATPTPPRSWPGVEDEVLVVDELPRYHLAGCRSLAGIPVIPLPAREAVELGFTPCAWCTPDRALSARHRAPAR